VWALSALDADGTVDTADGTSGRNGGSWVTFASSSHVELDIFSADHGQGAAGAQRALSEEDLMLDEVRPQIAEADRKTSQALGGAGGVDPIGMTGVDRGSLGRESGSRAPAPQHRSAIGTGAGPGRVGGDDVCDR
jgi:hypothetical protein